MPGRRRWGARPHHHPFGRASTPVWVLVRGFPLQLVEDFTPTTRPFFTLAL